MKKLAFVVPLLSKTPASPLEAMLYSLLEQLAQKGVALEVLTTCPRKDTPSHGEHFYPRGLSYVGEIPVRCFKLAPNRPHILESLSETLRWEKALTPVQETVFLNEMSNSDELMDYIDTHRYLYDLFVFTPYFSAVSYFGSTAAGNQAVLMPCLQVAESIKLPIFAQRYKQLAGMIFLSQQEQAFAQDAYDCSCSQANVLGFGAATHHGDGQRFRAKYGLGDAPFLLHCASNEQERETQSFVTLFEAYTQSHPLTPLKLVLFGGVALSIPRSCAHSILNLSIVCAQDQHDAYAAATVFCEPFPQLNFSTALPNSWLAERPVLVNSQCANTVALVEQANGGLYFTDYPEFAGALDYLLAHPDVANQMGQNGKEYAQKHCNGNSIADAYIVFFETIIAQIESAS